MKNKVNEISIQREEMTKQVEEIISIQQKEQVNDLQEELTLLGHTPSHPVDLCADILDYNSQSPSAFL